MGHLDKVRRFLSKSEQDEVMREQKCNGDSGQPEETVETESSVGDEVERMLALGERLRRKDIEAVRCGITGKRCTHCGGVPCLGSKPWDGNQ